MTQSLFANALLNPEAPVPVGVVDPEGRVSVKRFNVYRNNVVASLTDALAAGFPAVAKLVGDEFFAAMAKVYLQNHTPVTPILAQYGSGFPDFLATFGPVSHLRYLGDVAKLEIALRESYHAADHTALDPAILGQIAPEDLGALKLVVAPSARLLRSEWPILAIWQRNIEDPETRLPEGGQDVLVARQEFDPVPVALPGGAYAFFTALSDGQPLAAAAERAATEAPEFDATAALQLAFAHRLFCTPDSP
ncbi:MAG: DNA-binding domain-containing protein [Dinoroseobacter sp.]|nr:DNA-binding domain-containing protein [Dinoroseobacter sp.]